MEKIIGVEYDFYSGKSPLYLPYMVGEQINGFQITDERGKYELHKEREKTRVKMRNVKKEAYTVVA